MNKMEQNMQGKTKMKLQDVFFEKSKLWVYCDNKYQLSSQKVSNT